MDTLSPGKAISITQNIVYALPSQVVRVQSLAAVEISLDNSTYAVLANSTTGTETGAMYVRCTSGTTTIICKRLN